MSEKPTQAAYEAMKRLVQHEINQAWKHRCNLEDRREPADGALREEQLWKEIMVCIEACQRVDRVTRVESPE